MKKFRTGKRGHKLLLLAGVFLISIAFSIKYLYNHNLIKEETIISNLLPFNKDDKKLFSPEFLFQYVFQEKLNDSVMAFDDKEDEEEVSGDSIPAVYIYNTHPNEQYDSAYLENYNIRSDVMIAAKILKEYLKDLEIESIVETNNVTDKLNNLGWKYGSSYKVSRMFLEKTKENNPSLNYFIDLHRDAGTHKSTTTEIDNEYYAKILFVVGLDNKNYESNLQIANKICDNLKEYDEDLCRGIMKKSGSNVNGIYNQDFHQNTLLIEVGGERNNINEVNNSLKVLASALAAYIKDGSNE